MSPSRIAVRWLLVALFASVLAVPASGVCPVEGIGGTGLSGGADEGVGGTGLSGGSDEGVGGTGLSGGAEEGVGGTGLSGGGDEGPGGTGVFGTITGFGSICVNGLEINYEANTPVEVDGRRGTPQSLHVGDTVWVDAGPGERRLRARKIAVHSALVGPVDSQSGNFRVLGRPVKIGPRTALADRATGRTLSLADLSRATVAVRGLIDSDGSVRASRVERVPDGTPARAFGRLAGDGGRVGGVILSRAIGTARRGSMVVAEGRWSRSEGRFEVEDVREGWSGSKGAEALSVEGFVLERRGRSLELAYGEIVGRSPETFRDVGRGDRVVVRVRPLRDGRFEALDVRRQRPDTGRLDSRSRSDSSRDDDEHSRDRSGSGGGDRSDRSERTDRTDRADRSERPERAERAERPERPERAERPERPERAERGERPERPERSGRN